MFWRFYLSGLGLILVVMLVTGFIVRHTMGEPQFNDVAGRIFLHLFRPLPEGAGAGLQPERPADATEPMQRPRWGRRGLGRGLHGRPNPARIQARLEEMKEVLGGDLAVYDRDGKLLASLGEDVPPPLEADEARGLRRWKLDVGPRATVAVPIFGGPRAPYLRWRLPEKQHPQPLVFLTVALFATALIFYPVARSLSRPIERVAATAHALGEGDLDARTGIDRKDEIGALARSVDEAAERIAHLLRSEKEMLANVSHELRTPLARLRVAMELADEEQGMDAVRAHLAGMGADVAELDRLVGDILMAARLELARDGRNEAGFVLRPEPVAVKDLLRDAGERFATQHPEAKLAVVPPPGDVTLDIDGALVRRVLDNLLDNAAKYKDPDRPLQVEVAVTPLGDDLRFEVRDRGVGVSDEDLPRLFEAFFRADRSHSRKIRGTGLGLTLCRRIIEAHGGRIDVAQREGGGLVFGFELPASGAQKDAQVSGSQG